jgi:hypothetical protein
MSNERCKDFAQFCRHVLTSLLFDSDRLGQVAWTVHVAASEYGDVVREQLHGNDSQDSLEAVDSVRHFDKLRGVFLGLQVTFFADDNWTTLAGCHLLQGVDTFLKKKVKQKINENCQVCFCFCCFFGNLRRRLDHG